MVNPEGESENKPLRLVFDRRLKVEFHGSRITSDAGLLAYRELDDALGLTGMVGDGLVDARTGKNSQHAMTGLFRQSVFGRLGGYEDVFRWGPVLDPFEAHQSALDTLKVGTRSL
jgi:hypothetical protein